VKWIRWLPYNFKGIVRINLIEERLIVDKVMFKPERQKYFMEPCGQPETEVESIQQRMVEVKKNKRTDALEEIKRLWKKFGFTAGILGVHLLKAGRRNENAN
jgi:hypothetical protein